MRLCSDWIGLLHEKTGFGVGWLVVVVLGGLLYLFYCGCGDGGHLVVYVGLPGGLSGVLSLLDFDQRLECAAPKPWSKYTTDVRIIHPKQQHLTTLHH